jgi:enamine deaminase RidA (YjgF/YER057c/UK114 family)
MRGGLALLLLFALASLEAFAQPAAIQADPRRLVFTVAPISIDGDLAEQARRSLASFNLPIAHLRAFVVGADKTVVARRTIEEFFREKRRPLPTLAVIAVGALPHEGAQVVIEAVLIAKKPVNPHGVAFVSGQAASSDKPVAQVLPLAEKAVKDLNAVHSAAGIQFSDVIRVTCLVSSVADFLEVERRVNSAFPLSVLNFIQLQRSPARGVVECESVARLRSAAPEPLKFVYSDDLPKSPNFSHVALVGARRVVFTSLHVSTGGQESDARRTFSQLEQSLKTAGASIKQVAMSSIYPISQEASDLVRKTRFDFYDRARPPASTMLLFEGLPSATATFGVNVVAVKQ